MRYGYPPQCAVNAPQPLVVPASALGPKAFDALPEASSRVLIEVRVYRIDNFSAAARLTVGDL